MKNHGVPQELIDREFEVNTRYALAQPAIFGTATCVDLDALSHVLNWQVLQAA